mgnify:CR=1 FL=1
MTPKQKELARHALGLSNDRNQSYRNRFRASFASGDLDHWEVMSDNGYAIQSETIYKKLSLSGLPTKAQSWR